MRKYINITAGRFMRLSAALLLAAGAAALNSCVLDTYRGGQDDKSETITLKISVPAPTPSATRALLESDEYAVADVSVLAFDAAADTLKGRYSGRIVSGPTHTGGSSATATFEVSLPIGTFDLMLIANGNRILAANSAALTSGASRSSVEEALTMNMDTSGWNTGTGSAGYYGIPMWGYVKGVTIPSGSPVGTVCLTRMIAKVDVQLSATVIADGNFELRSVRVYNYVEQGRLIPDTEGSFDWTAVTQANLADNLTPSLPAGYTKAGPYAAPSEYLAYTAASPYESLKNSIYLFEAPAGVAPATDGDYIENTCLIVGGYYSPDGVAWGSESWYRIDFAKQTDATLKTYNYLPILRNNSYSVTITGVTGEGHSSPIEALENAPSNMTASVIDWKNPAILHLVTNGVYILGVSQDSFVFSGEARTTASADNRLTVVTDYSGGWTASVWADEAGTVAIPDDETSGLPWLRLSVSGGDGNHPNGNDIRLIADENTSGAARTAYVHIKAGGLSLIVKVTQAIIQLTPGSNCYMINNADPKTLVIPISHVGYAMGTKEVPENGFLGSGWIRDYTKLKAQVVWTDLGDGTGGKFGTPDAVVRSVEYNGATNMAKGMITVVPGSGIGNAGVILYEDNDGTPGYQYKTPPLTESDDRIIWSWHIWNTDYYPYDSNGIPNAADGTNTLGFMDRNLGAITNAYTVIWHHVAGFFYQWGRKDPHPSNNARSNTFNDYLYYATGSGIGFVHTETPETVNLPNSVMNPMTRYHRGVAPQDWFTATAGMQNHNLWGGGEETDFLHPAAASGYRKSVYDPCPAGYRIPNRGDWGAVYYLQNNTNPTINEAGWGNNASLTNYGRTNPAYGGYYPAAGRRMPNGSDLNSVGSFGYYWQTDNPVASAPGSSYILNFSSSTVSQNDFITRAYHASVRCRAE